jgi:hypothetical protein
MSALASGPLTLADELGTLVPVALTGLEKMQDAGGLFTHKSFLDSRGEFVTQGVNPLYTAACVVGLLSCDEGSRAPYAERAATALEALVHRTNESDQSVLGTMLWGCALSGHKAAPQVARRLISVVRARQASSMQLGLALTGLARWLAASDPRRVGVGVGVAATARRLAAELERRFIPRADVFAATAWPPKRRPLLYRLTSFASQVYPVLGLCELALVTGTEPPVAVGRVCDFMVEAQGDHGQWWWFYSTTARRVMEGYPVYSVHQDAMAAMALLAARRLGLGDDVRPLISGLRWVVGDNELGRSMVDSRAGLIHRAIQRAGGDADGVAGWSRGQCRAVQVAALTGRPLPAPRKLARLAECRSYHLGWLLLAAGMARNMG